MGNTWTRSNDAVLLLNLPAGATLTSSPTASFTNGIIPYAVVNTGGALNFATSSGATIVAANGGAWAALPASGATATINYQLTGGTSVTANESGNALQIGSNTGSPQTLTISSGTALTLASGGLLNSGSDAYTITGGSLASGAAADLIVNQYGSGSLTIGSVIAAGTNGLTKAGPGTLVLNNANVYTGVTSLYGGVMQIASFANVGKQISRTAGFNTLSTTITVSTGADLYPGMPVSGTGIAAGSLVQSITANQITLSLATTAVETGSALTLGASNNASNWNISGGTLRVAPNTYGYGVWGTTSLVPGTAGVGGDVTIDNGGNTVSFGNYGASGQGSVTSTGSGVLMLGTNSAKGAVNVNQGLVRSTGAQSGPPFAYNVANGAMFDLGGQSTNAVPINFQGTGVNGWGALINSSGDSTCTAWNLTGNATVGTLDSTDGSSIGRFDSSGTWNLNGYTLTKRGGSTIWLSSALTVNGGGNIVINSGVLGFNTASSTFTSPTTITVGPNGMLNSWGQPIPMANLSITLAGGYLGVGNAATVNNLAPITLTANSFAEQYSYDNYLWNTVGQSGGAMSFTKYGQNNLFIENTFAISGTYNQNYGATYLRSDYFSGQSNIVNGTMPNLATLAVNNGNFYYDNAQSNVYVGNRLASARPWP